jgi:hypothetical protein
MLGNIDHVDAGHYFEHLAVEMLRTAVAGRAQIDLSRIGLRIGDELEHGLGRKGPD